jgi:hypothetical protein
MKDEIDDERKVEENLKILRSIKDGMKKERAIKGNGLNVNEKKERSKFTNTQIERKYCKSRRREEGERVRTSKIKTLKVQKRKSKVQKEHQRSERQKSNLSDFQILKKCQLPMA